MTNDDTESEVEGTEESEIKEDDQGEDSDTKGTIHFYSSNIDRLLTDY